MPKSIALVYWLIPAKSQRDFFSETIRILSKQFNAPCFEPHLTIIVTPEIALEKLTVDLARETRSRAKSAHDPHLSLIYKKMPTSAKKELASAIQLPFSTVLFNSIKAVRCALPTKTRSDVEAWRVVAKKSLRW